MLTHALSLLLAHDPPFVFADLVLDAPNNAPARSFWDVLTSPGGRWFIGMLITATILAHPFHQLALWLKAHADAIRAQHPVEAAAEDKLVSLADILDAWLTANGHEAKDLADPAKRAAAMMHLANAGQAVIEGTLAKAEAEVKP